MPPSPSLRCSPGRERRMENTHKRGRSFEIGLTLKAKDDDLALFSDMQNKEREGFLLHTTDDFDDSLSKLRYLSDFRLGVNIPARGESSDLLNADGDKNDYDWLLTPPDTPLFPSLDDDEPQRQNLLPRGRSRSQPINISRSLSMNERTRGTSRGSASPHRLSPSPRSSTTSRQSMSRPSTASRSSPSPVLRPGTPSRRPSTPPNKPTTPTPRSSTPTYRKTDTISSGQPSSSGRRGTSPMRASRGNSASQKLRGWQSNIPDFPSDAPPNLRTSVSDRPSPHMRGLFPTPRSGKGRHTMSPTASKSASLSHSNDRDLFSSYSKGSVVSSGDDDVDSLQSFEIPSSAPRRNGLSINSRPVAFSKKPSRNSPSYSVPKRSFESLVRQMDQRKTPQNMFRPLMSSVPSTTFYGGKSNNTYRPMFSRNSSLTTSTSASSDQGASIAPDMEGSEHDQNELTVEWERTHDPDTQEEVFIFDKVDDVTEDTVQELHTVGFDADISNKIDTRESERSVVTSSGVTSPLATEAAYGTGNSSVVDGCEIMAICSRCRKRFHLLGVDGETELCQECTNKDGIFAVEPSLNPSATQNQTVELEVNAEMDIPVNEVQLSVGIPELNERRKDDSIVGQHGNISEEVPKNSCPVQLVMDQLTPHISEQQLESKEGADPAHSKYGNKFGQTEPTSLPSHMIENPEGTGISVLLQQSSSSKWPVVRSRDFSATNIHCAEPSYLRDNTSFMKCSISQDSVSASSSVDLGSSRQMGVCIQGQISGGKSEVDSVRSDTNADAKSQCSGSYSDIKINAYESSVPSKDYTEGRLSGSTEGMEKKALQGSGLVTGEIDSSSDLTDIHATHLSSSEGDLVDSDAHINGDCFPAKDSSDSQLLGYMEMHHYGSSEEALKDEDCPSCINDNEGPWRKDETRDIEEPKNIPNSFVISEETVLNGPTFRSDISDTAMNSSSVFTLESPHDHASFQDLQTEREPAGSPNNGEASHERSLSTTSSTTSHKGMLVSTLESELDDHTHGIHEESTVVVEGSKGQASRSLTLAEATDSILFCSSIIHDIAYKAVSIAMDKESAILPETSRPTVTILGKTASKNDSRKAPSKHSPKSQKFRRKRSETPNKSPLTESGNNVIVQESKPANGENIPHKVPDSIKPPKLESKCNCAVM
ncbi:uncharacterized protein A4U43_C09F6290 [Asparagus officinalis]|uniref:Uncharacterized protein n=1 Tax=Asparagus officinalis TaxID=4686 RepID=A0A5P1E677_ASPOF|nr:uncharacterized protein LOC109823821 [Asparagus officinalis]ONK57969.1 uncharacterized protein A4U43_C09F6290 [Asparagus officinalis]